MSSFTAAWALRVHLVLRCVAVCPVVSKNWTFQYMNQQKIISERIFWLKTTRAAQTSVWLALKCAILSWKSGMRNHALANACTRMSHRKSMLARNGSGTLKSQRELPKSLSLRFRLLIAWTDFGAIVKVEIYAMNESPRQLTFLSPTHTPRCFVLAIWGHPKNRLHAAPLRWANGPQHTYVKFPGGSWKANVPYNDQNVALTRSETLGKKTFKNFKSETASIPCEHRLFDLPI